MTNRKMTGGNLRSQFNFQKLSLSELVRDVFERLKNEVSFISSKFSVCIEHEIEGYWDKVRLEQVVENLLLNAMKYGNGKPVELSLSRVDDLAILSVLDRGPGIRKDLQKKVFSEPGLGLSTSRQIVEAHGGGISVESEMGAGSRFVVSLPLSHKKPDVATIPALRSAFVGFGG
jgi:signal transduction histidine kinase